MADHRVRIRILADAVGVECRDCLTRLDDGARQAWLVSELADLAHEHIEAAERASVGAEGYRPESVPFWPGQQHPLS